MSKQKKSTSRIANETNNISEAKYISETEDISEIKKVQFEAILAEYNVLRNEIDSYHHHQNEIINFLIAIIVGVFGIIGIQDANGKYIEKLDVVFLLLPIICLILACLYTDRTIRIIRIADYLHNYVRVQVNQIVQAKTFQWEIYKRKTKLFDKRITFILDKIRWTIFFVPSVVSIIIFFCQTDYPLSFVQIVLSVVAGTCTLVQFIVMFIAEETKGIKDHITNLED